MQIATDQAEKIERLIRTVSLNPWIKHRPHPKQREFLALDGREVLYGGAAGGGKSDALLMAAAQYFDVPGYSAILFRRTFADLALPGALIDRSHEWWDGTAARWHEQRKIWTFPSGATLAFGYMENPRDRYRYQGSEVQFCGFDELTQFPLLCYTYLFSRLRRLKGVEIPLRIRAASNPGGEGHDWVRARFIDGMKPFVPARLDDNPSLDRESYLQSLNELDPVTRAQLLKGDWSARQAGGLFRAEWLPIVEASDVPSDAQRVRFWDMAATVAKPGTDPDWTVGLRMAMHEGRYWIEDVQRFRERPAETEQIVRRTAQRDGASVTIRMEQEPGSSGVIAIDHYARKVLPGFDFKGVKSTGDKIERARPLSAACEQGNVSLVRGPWNADLIEEYEAFPHGTHDDQVDGGSGAMSELAGAVELFVL